MPAILDHLYAAILPILGVMVAWVAKIDRAVTAHDVRNEHIYKKLDEIHMDIRELRESIHERYHRAE